MSKHVQQNPLPPDWQFVTQNLPSSCKSCQRKMWTRRCGRARGLISRGNGLPFEFDVSCPKSSPVRGPRVGVLRRDVETIPNLYGSIKRYRRDQWPASIHARKHLGAFESSYSRNHRWFQYIRRVVSQPGDQFSWYLWCATLHQRQKMGTNSWNLEVRISIRYTNT